MESFDVIIIGAGPGGLNCAEKLQKAGLETTLNGISMGKCSEILKDYKEDDYFETYLQLVRMNPR